MARMFLAFALCLAAATAACSGDDGSPVSYQQPNEPVCEEPVCEPGRQEACACPGGEQGAQSCLADGSGWGACECPDAATEPGQDAADEEPVGNDAPDAEEPQDGAPDAEPEDGDDGGDAGEDVADAAPPCQHVDELACGLGATCEQCIEAKCTAQCGECTAGPLAGTCRPLFQCICDNCLDGGPSGGELCVPNCEEAYPLGVNPYEAVVLCVAANCATECAGAPYLSPE